MSIAKKISFVMIGQLLNTVFNILMLPYLARALSVEEYGTYGQVMLVGGIVQVVFALGLAKVIFVQFAQEKEREKDVFMTNIILAAVFGGIGAFLVFLSSGYIGNIFSNETAGYLLQYYTFFIVFAIIAASLDSTLIFFGKVKLLISIGVVMNLVRIALLLICIQVFHSLLLVMYALVITSFVGMIAKLIVIPKSLFKGNFDWNLSTDQLKIGVPLGLSGTIGMLLKYTDGLMVSSMLNPVEYAYYRMGAIEVPFLATIYSAVSTIVLPEVTKLNSNNKMKELVALKKKSLGIQQP